MKTETSHIWLGCFPDGAPADFFEERRNRKDEEALSAFAESQGQMWYDHDCVEISFLNAPVRITELLEGHSYSEQYLSAVLAAARSAEMEMANVFVLASEAAFPQAQTVSGTDYLLRYIGKFIYAL